MPKVPMTSSRMTEHSVVVRSPLETIEGFIQHARILRRKCGKLLEPTRKSKFFRISLNTTCTGGDVPVFIELLDRVCIEEPIRSARLSVEDFHKELSSIVERYRADKESHE